MIYIDLEELRGRLDDYLARAAEDVVVVVQENRPWIVMHVAPGTVNATPEGLDAAAAFWHMIRRRRTEGQDLPWDEAKAQLGLDKE